MGKEYLWESRNMGELAVGKKNRRGKSVRK